MIPAILTCVYVVYLYRTLNEAATDETAATDGSPTGSVTVDQLADRLSAFENRPQALASSNSSGRTPS